MAATGEFGHRYRKSVLFGLRVLAQVSPVKSTTTDHFWYPFGYWLPYSTGVADGYLLCFQRFQGSCSTLWISRWCCSWECCQGSNFSLCCCRWLDVVSFILCAASVCLFFFNLSADLTLGCYACSSGGHRNNLLVRIFAGSSHCCHQYIFDSNWIILLTCFAPFRIVDMTAWAREWTAQLVAATSPRCVLDLQPFCYYQHFL